MKGELHILLSMLNKDSDLIDEARGRYVHQNTIISPEKWGLRILQEGRDAKVPEGC